MSLPGPSEWRCRGDCESGRFCLGLLRERELHNESFSLKPRCLLFHLLYVSREPESSYSQRNEIITHFSVHPHAREKFNSFELGRVPEHFHAVQSDTDVVFVFLHFSEFVTPSSCRRSSELSACRGLSVSSSLSGCAVCRVICSDSLINPAGPVRPGCTAVLSESG
ncbi:hypothetical protein MHYP_G00230840 [Metynnis hypsauchen]